MQVFFFVILRHTYKERYQRSNNMVRMIIGPIVGAVIGFAYYKFIGCSSGVCPITSSP